MDKNKLINNMVLKGVFYDYYMIFIECMLMFSIYYLAISGTKVSIIFIILFSILILIGFIISLVSNIRYYSYFKKTHLKISSEKLSYSEAGKYLYSSCKSFYIGVLYFIASRIIVPYLLVNLTLIGKIKSLGIPLIIIFIVFAYYYNYIRKSGIHYIYSKLSKK